MLTTTGPQSLPGAGGICPLELGGSSLNAQGWASEVSASDVRPPRLSTGMPGFLLSGRQDLCCTTVAESRAFPRRFGTDSQVSGQGTVASPGYSLPAAAMSGPIMLSKWAPQRGIIKSPP